MVVALLIGVGLETGVAEGSLWASDCGSWALWPCGRRTHLWMRWLLWWILCSCPFRLSVTRIEDGAAMAWCAGASSCFYCLLQWHGRALGVLSARYGQREGFNGDGFANKYANSPGENPRSHLLLDQGLLVCIWHALLKMLVWWSPLGMKISSLTFSWTHQHRHTCIDSLLILSLVVAYFSCFGHMLTGGLGSWSHGSWYICGDSVAR